MIYEKIYEARLGEYNKSGNITMQAILDILADIGAHHSAAANDDILEGSMGGIAWILVEWNVEIVNRPKRGDNLYIETWVTGKAPSTTAYREFVIKDANGNACVYACAKFVLLDMNSGKLTRITKEMFDSYKPEETIKHEFASTKLREPEIYALEKPLFIRRNDIDFNNHVHNTRYMEYALDAIAQKAYDKDSYKAVRIMYKAPIQLFDKITAKCFPNDNSYIVGIYKQDGTLCALIEINI